MVAKNYGHKGEYKITKDTHFKRSHLHYQPKLVRTNFCLSFLSKRDGGLGGRREVGLLPHCLAPQLLYHVLALGLVRRADVLLQNLGGGG